MIDDQIKNQPNASLVAFLDELLSVLESAEGRVHIFIVRDIIPIVLLWRFVVWAQPEDVHTEIFEVIELGDYTRDVTYTITIAVFE